MNRTMARFPRVSVAAFLGALSIYGFPRSHAGAQELTHVAIVDSANAARAAWARAVAAMQKHADSTARREVARAANAWPTQSAYVWGEALLAARANDTVTALRALRDYAKLGLGRDLRADTSVARLLSAPGFAAVLVDHNANRAALVRSHIRAKLADSTFWPEGVDVDPRTHRYYVASIRHRTIAEIRPDGTSRELITRDQHDLGAIFGVRFDARRGVLWATTSGVRQTEGYVAADSAIGALLKIRVADGTIEQRWNVPVRPGGHVLGDLADVVQQGMCMSPTQMSPCFTDCAPAPIRSKQFAIRCSTICRAWHPRQTGGSSTYRIIRTACCALTSRRTP